MTNRPTHFDEIERLLRETLGDYKPPAPERVWKRVEARLPKRRRPFGWWPAGIGLAAVVLGGLAVRSANQEPPAPIKPQAFMQVMDNEATSPKQTLQLDGGQNGNQPEKPFESVPQAASVFRAEEIVKKKEASTDFGNDFQAIVPADEQTATPRLANQMPVNAIESKRFDLLAMLPLSETTVKATPRLPSFPPVEIAPNKRSSRWSAGIRAAPVWQWRQESFGIDQPGHIRVAEQIQNPSAGLQLGASVSYQFNPRWRLETGLWQQTIVYTHAHAATLRLMDGICLNPNDPGTKQYRFHYAFRPEGSRPAEVTMYVKEAASISPISLDEPFVVRIQTTHREAEWLVPLSAQRVLGQGRWMGSVRGGAVLGISGDTGVQIKSLRKDFTNLNILDDHSPVVMVNNRPKLSLRFLLGASVEYRLAPRWQLVVEPILIGKTAQFLISTNTGIYFHF